MLFQAKVTLFFVNQKSNIYASHHAFTKSNDRDLFGTVIFLLRRHHHQIENSSISDFLAIAYLFQRINIIGNSFR
ncbi:hypothetical protein [Sphingobacterium lumbrici]|uniref:hypothetical protein n=1 Tax=Sphingobacterium lumbrici TaxID=2559600 RepID=UPI00112BFD97|nr:hypothetical protein [Sphingobacterium lumbrici]